MAPTPRTEAASDRLDDHVDAAGRPVPRLHVLTPERVGEAEVRAIRQVVTAGAPLVQVRLKHVGDGQAYETVREVVGITRAADATCVVDDRVAVTLAADADGVHLGAEDLPVAAARALLDLDPRPRLVGGTARDPQTATRLVAEGADYLGVGPCYPTDSKSGLPDPGGPDRVAAVAEAVDVPIIAISGVTAARVPDLLAAGAHGVAVLGAVWGADDPPRAVVELLEALGTGPGSPT